MEETFPIHSAEEIKAIRKPIRIEAINHMNVTEAIQKVADLLEQENPEISIEEIDALEAKLLNNHSHETPNDTLSYKTKQKAINKLREKIKKQKDKE